MFDKQLLKHLCNLSKLEVEDAELDSLAQEMGDIINLMDTITKSDYEYMQKDASDAVHFNALREDNKTASFNPDEILANAAETKNNMFSVPKLME